jgi:hypothetical protein
VRERERERQRERQTVRRRGEMGARETETETETEKEKQNPQTNKQTEQAQASKDDQKSASDSPRCQRTVSSEGLPEEGRASTRWRDGKMEDGKMGRMAMKRFESLSSPECRDK